MLLSLESFIVLWALVAPTHAFWSPSAGLKDFGQKSTLTKVELAELRRTGSVDQVPVGRGLHPAEKVYHDHVRWLGKASRHIIEARDAAVAAIVSNGTVQAADQPADAEYLTPITIGKQQFHVILDSGSSDLWVFSTQLPSSERGSNHSLYKETGEQYTDPYESWNISYADGTGASGNVWYDNITLGGITHGVAVEAASQVSSGFTNSKQDGLIGFAFDSGNTCSPYQCYTFMTLIQPQLKKPLFTSTLRKGKAGTYDFGFIDPNKYTGSIGYVTADNSSSYWGLTPGGYSIGSGSKVNYAFDTIADTGTVLLYVPGDILNAYYAKVKGAFKKSSDQFVYFPCTSTLPSFSLYIGSHKATIPGSYLNAAADNSTTCLGSMQDEAHVGSSILGIEFLKSQFVVFDVAVPKLGFAQQKGLPSS